MLLVLLALHTAAYRLVEAPEAPAERAPGTTCMVEHGDEAARRYRLVAARETDTHASAALRGVWQPCDA